MQTSPEGAVYKNLYSLIRFCSVGPCKWGGVFSATPLKLRICPLLLIFCLSEWVCESLSSVRPFATPWTVAAPGSSVHGHSPGKNAGGGCHSLLQGIFPAQGSNLHLLSWQAEKGVSRGNYVHVKALWWWLRDDASYHGFSWPSSGHSGRILRDLIILWNSIKTLPRYWI